MPSMIVGIILLLSLAIEAFALEHVEVRALFSGAAMLNIDGQEKLIREGDPEFHGVTLVSADPEQAIVEYEGTQHTLYLSDLIGTRFAVPDKAQVIVAMNEKRQYVTHGSINGRSVRFLVDTGANVVALNSQMAAGLGISTIDGEKTLASTASDQTQATLVTIKEIQVGDIRRNNVRAVVMEGGYPQDVLLGMSFLQQIEITKNADVMVLTSKF